MAVSFYAVIIFTAGKETSCALCFYLFMYLTHKHQVLNRGSVLLPHSRVRLVPEDLGTSSALSTRGCTPVPNIVLALWVFFSPDSKAGIKFSVLHQHDHVCAPSPGHVELYLGTSTSSLARGIDCA